jgi:hypothetical protein
MKKLRLDLEEICVDTFCAEADSAQGHGTVAARLGWAMGDDTQKPDCDASGPPSCGYSFCGDDTCGTCDYNSYCGESCILVCDYAVEAAAR